MGHFISRAYPNVVWADYIIRRPNEVRKEETKIIKKKTKSQSESDSYSDTTSSSDAEEFVKEYSTSSELP